MQGGQISRGGSMTEGWLRQGSGPYHAQELEVQARAGVTGDAARLSRMTGRVLSPAVRQALAEERMAVAASIDEAGWVWASLLTGTAGFLRPVDEGRLVIQGGF